MMKHFATGYGMNHAARGRFTRLAALVAIGFIISICTNPSVRSSAELTDAEKTALLSETLRIVHTEAVRRSFLDNAGKLYVVGDEQQIELLKELNDPDIIPLTGDEFSKIQSRRDPKGYLRFEFTDEKPKSVSIVLTWFGGRRGANGAIQTEKRVLEFHFVKKHKNWDLDEMRRVQNGQQ